MYLNLTFSFLNTLLTALDFVLRKLYIIEIVKKKLKNKYQILKNCSFIRNKTKSNTTVS